MQTENSIGDTGATSLSEALKSNSTLKALDLTCGYPQITHKQFVSCVICSQSTDCGIGETGATSLGEALETNVTLTALNLTGEQA